MGQRLAPLEQHPHFSAALKIITKLKQNGFAALFAGGCVRDAWLGLTAADIDIATSARPDDIARLFSKTLDVGKAFGTMVVVTPEGNFEVTTFRKDGDYLDGRHPTSVDFSDAEEDAKRRDFTINALFYDPVTHETIDYVSGLQDLEQKIIRTVGEPDARFTEDQLRLLRAVRFSSQLGFDIELKTWKAIENLSAKIQNVSRERVWQEVLKLLKGKSVRSGIERLARSRLAGGGVRSGERPISGGVWPTLQTLFDDKENWKAFMDRAEWLHHPETIFAIFATLTPQPDLFYQDLESLKPPRQFMQTVKSLAQTHGNLWKKPSRTPQRIRALGSADGMLILEMSEAEAMNSPGGETKLGVWIAEYLRVCDSKGNLPKPFLSGADLLKLGFKPGPALGKVLEEVYSLQLEGEISTLPQAERLAQTLMDGTSNEV